MAIRRGVRTSDLVRQVRLSNEADLRLEVLASGPERSAVHAISPRTSAAVA
jgi:hypothetical protein